MNNQDASTQSSFLTYNQAMENYETVYQSILDSVHQEMKEMSHHLFQGRGKGIRAQVVLLSAMNNDGRIPTDAPKLACAIEILHLATLVHDDVIDDAPTRRGLESVQSLFGRRQAVLCGDYLLSLAFGLVTEIATSQTYDPKNKMNLLYFSGLVRKICVGELKQMRYNQNTGIHLLEYLRVISGKTAALFILAAQSGAMLGGCSDSEVKKLNRFGRYLGMIFQIVDDCKDYEFSKDEALKPVQNDIQQGVITLPLILAMAKEPHIRPLALEVLQGHKEVAQLVEQVLNADGTNDALRFCKKYYKKAKAILISLEEKEKADALMILLNRSCSGFLKHMGG